LEGEWGDTEGCGWFLSARKIRAYGGRRSPNALGIEACIGFGERSGSVVDPKPDRPAEQAGSDYQIERMIAVNIAHLEVHFRRIRQSKREPGFTSAGAEVDLDQISLPAGINSFGTNHIRSAISVEVTESPISVPQ
jgi:hypothetical protein